MQYEDLIEKIWVDGTMEKMKKTNDFSHIVIVGKFFEIELVINQTSVKKQKVQNFFIFCNL